MAGDGEEYVYTEIEHAVDDMQSFTTTLNQNADDLTKRVKNLIDGGKWSGQTATDYQQRATTLGQKIDAAAQLMQSTGKAVREGAERMLEADKSGAKGVAGN